MVADSSGSWQLNPSPYKRCNSEAQVQIIMYASQSSAAWAGPRHCHGLCAKTRDYAATPVLSLVPNELETCSSTSMTAGHGLRFSFLGLRALMRRLRALLNQWST